MKGKELPGHVVFVMDGNGRWAEKRELPVFDGHREGAETMRKVIDWLADRGINTSTFYALSTENYFERPAAEIRDILKIAEEFIDKYGKELDEKGARVRILGRREGLPRTLLEKMAKLELATYQNCKISVTTLFNYGGRAEIVDAFRKMGAEGIKPEQITEEKISEYLYTHDLPDPDLIIRTGGETPAMMRLSNLLLYQTAYSEFYTCPTLWPDFSAKDLDKALDRFKRRKRNFGK